MKNSAKLLKPKANSLLDFSFLLQNTDPEKTKTLGNALSELIEKESFPSPIQKFIDLPKFREIVSLLKEGAFDTETLASTDIHSLQLLVESFHKLVHLNYDFEEIDEPVVQAKVLEQNIQDYLICIDFIYPYEGKLINQILVDLFHSIHFFIGKLTATISKSPQFFSAELISFMKSPVVSLLSNLDRSNYKNFAMEEWYPVSIELNIDSNLGFKKRELADLAKGNGHKLLNQLQTILSDMSRIYLKHIPSDMAQGIKTAILASLAEKPKEEKISGQKVNELFYLEFWKEPYEVILTKEKGFLTKLQALSHRLWPLKESLYSLITEYEFGLPEDFSYYITEVIRPSDKILSIVGKPNFLGAQLSIGFYNTQYEYMNELLSAIDHKKIPPSSKERIDLILPTLFSFLETYYYAKPFPSLHVMKNLLENFFSGSDAFELFTIADIEAKIEQTFTLLTPSENPPISLLAASLNKIIQELHLLLNELDPTTIEHRILQEKLTSLEKIDIPSFSASWYILGELLGVLFMFLSQVEDCFLEAVENRIKNLFSYRFFQVLFHTKTLNKPLQ